MSLIFIVDSVQSKQISQRKKHFVEKVTLVIKTRNARFVM